MCVCVCACVTGAHPGDSHSGICCLLERLLPRKTAESELMPLRRVGEWWGCGLTMALKTGKNLFLF